MVFLPVTDFSFIFLNRYNNPVIFLKEIIYFGEFFLESITY